LELSNKIKLALWWRKLTIKNNLGVNSMSLSIEGQTPKRFLIILPEQTRESELAKRFIHSMKNALGSKSDNQMRIIGPAIVGNLIDLADFRDFILFSDKDLNRLGLPGKELLWSCQRINVDAILDLNQNFNPISAVLSETVNAPLKVGFFSDNGENYYNILIRCNGEELAESGFKEVFQILGIR